MLNIENIQTDFMFTNMNFFQIKVFNEIMMILMSLHSILRFKMRELLRRAQRIDVNKYITDNNHNQLYYKPLASEGL